MRKKYSEEYKTSAVKMVLVEGKSPTEVAHNLGFSVSLLHKWIRKYKGIDSPSFGSNHQLPAGKIAIFEVWYELQIWQSYGFSN